MSSRKTYHELLKDSQWQKKRLEIMEKSNFSCRNCGDEKATLHIHHGAYISGLKPWEYPDRMLHCLCESCHIDAEDHLDRFRKAYGSIGFEYLLNLSTIIEVHRDNNFLFTLTPFDQLASAIHAFCELVGLDDGPFLEVADALHGKTQRIIQLRIALQNLQDKRAEEQ